MLVTSFQDKTILPVAQAPGPERSVFFIGSLSREADELLRQLAFYGYALTVLPETGPLLPPTAACFIVGLASKAKAKARFSWMKTLRRSRPDIPIIVLGQESSALRLQAIQAGSSAYFVLPVNISPFVDCLDRLTGKTDPIPLRILIANDAEPAAAFYALSLQNAHMHTACVTEACALGQVMSEFDPDLVLMNLALSGYSGGELAEFIRQQEAYVGVPIIFLASETDSEQALEAIKSRGDEVFAKPVNITHLTAAVKNRALSFRQIKAMIVRDSLTGLYNHRHLKELLQRELQLAQRQEQVLQFVMLDLDHFKQVNDRFGHLVGDRVIKMLARLLKQRLRSTDIMGRYGGEEFAVILPNTQPEQARFIIDTIRQQFSDIVFMSEKGQCKVTFSAGIASYPEFDQENALVHAADEALYSSKKTGRNRVTVAARPAMPVQAEIFPRE